MFGSQRRRQAAADTLVRSILDAAGVGLAVLDDAARLVVANDAWHRALGREPGAAGGQDVRELVPPPCLLLRRAIEEARTGKVAPLPAHRVASAGRERWVEGQVSPVSLDGEPGFLLTLTDVTESKHASDALLAREAQLRISVANAAVGFALTTPEGRFLEVNPAYCAIVGYSIEELQRLTLLGLAHPDDGAALSRQLNRLLAGELSDFVLESRDRRRDGEAVWVRRSVSVVRSTPGPARWIVVLVEDVTARRLAAEALHASEERFRRVFERASIGIVLTGDDGRIEATNPAFERLLGYAPGELTGVPGRELMHPEDRDHNLALLANVDDGSVPGFELENRYLRKDGSAVWVHKYVSRLEEGPGKPAYMVLVTDVTERRRAEEALRESEARVNAICEAAPLGVALLERPGNVVVKVNEAFLRLHAVGREALLGRALGELGYADAAERARVREALSRDGRVRGLRVHIVDAAGAARDLTLDAEPITIGGRSYLLAMVQDVSGAPRATA